MKKLKFFSLFLTVFSLTASLFTFNNSLNQDASQKEEIIENSTSRNTSYGYYPPEDEPGISQDQRQYPKVNVDPTYRILPSNYLDQGPTINLYVGDYCWLAAGGGGFLGKYMGEDGNGTLYGLRNYDLSQYGLYKFAYYNSVPSHNDGYDVYSYDGYFTKPCELTLYYVKATWLDVKNVNNYLKIIVTEKPIEVIEPQDIEVCPPYYDATGRYIQTSFVYNGEEQGPALNQAALQYFNIYENSKIKATDAGTYGILFTCKDGYTLSNGKKSCTLSWEIKKDKLLDDVYIEDNIKTWTGETFTVEPKSKNPLDDGKWEIVDTDERINSKNTFSTSKVGLYLIKVRPKKNYTWKDGKTETKAIHWEIDAVQVPRPYLSTTNKTEVRFQYTGVKRGDWLNYIQNYDENFMTMNFYNSYDYELKNPLTEEPVNSGTYIAIFSLRNKVGWSWDNGRSYNIDPYTYDLYLYFIIEKQVVTVPSLENKDVTYNGSDYIPQFKNMSDQVSIVDYETHNQPGNYEIKLKLNDPINYRWDDSTIDVYNPDPWYEEDFLDAYRTLNYSIGRIQLKKPDIVGEVTYEGNSIDPVMNNYDGSLMKKVISRDPALINGYFIDLSLNDKDHYMWSDGTDDSFRIECTVGKALVVKPTIIQTEFNYDAEDKHPIVEGFDSRYMEYGEDPTRSKAGLSYLVIRLKNKELSTWSDNSLDDIYFTMTVNKQIIDPVTIEKTKYNYTGKAISPLVSSYDLAKVDVIIPKAIKPNIYKITVSLKDKENYTWNDGTSEDKYIYFEISNTSADEAKSSRISSNQSPYLWLIIGLVGGTVLISTILVIILAYKRRRKDSQLPPLNRFK